LRFFVDVIFNAGDINGCYHIFHPCGCLILLSYTLRHTKREPAEPVTDELGFAPGFLGRQRPVQTRAAESPLQYQARLARA